jgi:uncharacterized protein (TIGR03089 family)
LTVTDKLLGTLLRQPSRPLITHYDEAYGSRIELSVATVANWAAKSANWLRDECDIKPGADVAVLLPAHWQTVGVLLGSWWCGARITDEPSGAAVAFVPPTIDAKGAEITAIVALDPLGRGLPSPPTTGYDFIADVHSYADDFTSEPIPGDAPAFLDSTVDETVAAARDRATSLAITNGARVLSTMVWTYPDGLLSGLLAVLAANASLVQCDPIDATTLAKRRHAERTTVDLV